MSCRSQPSSSAATTFARLNAHGLNDTQTVSAYHALRSEAPALSPAPTLEQWHEWLDRESGYVTAHPNLTDARKTSLLRRLSAARQGDVPDGRTWVALQRIRAVAVAQAGALNNRCRDLSERLGVPQSEVRAMFVAAAAEVDTSRSAPPPSGYTAAAVRAAHREGLPVDRPTVHALSVLDERVRRREAETAVTRRGPQHRVKLMPTSGGTLSAIGYDHTDGRLEVVFRDHPDRVHAYRGVPEDVFDAMVVGDPAQVWRERVSGQPRYRYRDAEQATRDGVTRRCPGCGQFASIQHSCPQRRVNLEMTERWDTYQASIGPDGAVARILSPPLPDIRDRLAAGQAVSWELSSRLRPAGGGGESVSGVVVAAGSGSETQVWLFEAECTCDTFEGTGTCPHLGQHRDAVLRSLDRMAADRQAVETAQRAAEAALAVEHARSEAIGADLERRWAPGPENYVASPERFERAAAAAHRRVRHGEPAVPYMVEDATGGLLTRESGRPFGVEIEFDFPADWSSAQRAVALRAIGEDLYGSGLTRMRRQEEYGAAREDGPRETHRRGWSFEEDASVAGEVVSPVMYDEPETWENLKTVCDVIRRHGGTATARAGGHVHVSAESYDHDSQNHTELLRLANEHEDVLFRLAQNPAARKHRPLDYCQPNRDVPPAGYRTVNAANVDHGEHVRVVNLTSVTGAVEDHVEFRHWDASLDPGVIQAQVKVSAGLTAAAQRLARSGSSPRPGLRLGHHAAVRRADVVGGEARGASGNRAARDAETRATRELLDTIFERPQDKEQVAALWAVTRWQSRDAL